MMYKVFLKYPEALRPAFPRLKEKLEDPDPGKYKYDFCQSLVSSFMNKYLKFFYKLIFNHTKLVNFIYAIFVLLDIP